MAPDLYSPTASMDVLLEQAETAERHLRDELAVIAGHQQRRKRVIADSTPRRNELASTVAQLDAALDLTRPERVPRPRRRTTRLLR